MTDKFINSNYLIVTGVNMVKKKELDVPGYTWLTNDNPRPIDEKGFLGSYRSNEKIAIDWAKQLDIPVEDVLIRTSEIHGSMRAVYRRNQTPV